MSNIYFQHQIIFSLITSIFNNYTIDIAILQIFLSIILFFSINWLGEKSISVGYMQLSLTIKEDTAPAFNLLFKVISPIVFLILCACLFQEVGLDNYNKNCFLIVIYYWIIRFLYILTTNRITLTNWSIFLLYASISITLSVFIYNILQKVDKILPNPQALLDQLWILIIIFLYSIFNKLQLSKEKTKKRKIKYIESRYKKFHYEYNKIIISQFKKPFYEALTYSIMIYEDFNRPAIIRYLEFASFFITKKTHTLGIMQIKTNKFINDEESIKLATNKILLDSREFFRTEFKDYMKNNIQYYLISYITNKYNGGDYNYSNEIHFIYNIINEKFYGNNSDNNLII